MLLILLVVIVVLGVLMFNRPECWRMTFWPRKWDTIVGADSLIKRVTILHCFKLLLVIHSCCSL